MAPSQKPLKEVAKPSQNPTMLGDPTSLKAETTPNSPTKDEAGAAGSSPGQGHDPNSIKNLAPTEQDTLPSQQHQPKQRTQDGNRKGLGRRELRDLAPTERAVEKGAGSKGKSLKQMAEENPTRLGDPVSLKAETSNSSPTEHDRGAGGSNKRKSKL